MTKYSSPKFIPVHIGIDTRVRKGKIRDGLTTPNNASNVHSHNINYISNGADQHTKKESEEINKMNANILPIPITKSRTETNFKPKKVVAKEPLFDSK